MEEAETWRACRTCMREDDQMCSLFEEDASAPPFADMLAACTGLQVEKSDGLPEQVCGSCFQAVSGFYQFRCEAERADRDLRDILALRRSYTIKVEPPHAVKLEPNDSEHALDIINDCADDRLDNKSESESDDPLIKLEDVKSKIKKEHCCTVCGKLFQKLSKLQRHEKIHTKVRPAPASKECAICFKKFKKAVHLVRHSIVHDPKRRPFECAVCLRRFSNNGTLLSHVVSHQRPSSDCNVKMEIEIPGIESRDAPERHPCVHCADVFQSQASLCAHMRKHRTAGRVLACPICGKTFKKLSHLKRHERSHEDNRPFKCNLCPKSYPTEVQLEEHINKHKGVKPHVCPVCEKAFAQRGTLTAHLRVHTREKPYLCPTCGKRFDSSTNLKQHMRRHAGDKAFACTYCPGRYVSKGELNSHMSIHTGARPYVCDSCGSSFTKPNSLAKHKMRHQGIKPHECDVCFIKFTSKEHLKRHYRIHTGEKPYQCELCERAFTQSNDLVKHKRAHLGENLYKCKECSQSFRLKTELRNHISGHFISSQVAAGVPISLPPEVIIKPLRDKPDSIEPEDTAKTPIVVTRASEDTVLTVEKASQALAQSLLGSNLSDVLIADHVRNIPTAITVKRISSLT